MNERSQRYNPFFKKYISCGNMQLQIKNHIQSASENADTFHKKEQMRKGLYTKMLDLKKTNRFKNLKFSFRLNICNMCQSGIF